MEKEKKLGIICATDEELTAIKDIMKDTNNRVEKYGIYFFDGKIENTKVVVVKCGVGKVNAARTAQILIDNFDISEVINVGVAGGLNYKLNIGDIVIGKKLVQHDFDISAFGHSKGYVPEIGNIVESNSDMVDKFEKVAKKIDFDGNIICGTIATGDIFVTEPVQKDKLVSNFKADACEMEGASIAQICYLANIPFIGIRSISDTPNGNNQMDYNEFVNKASENVSALLKQYCK